MVNVRVTSGNIVNCFSSVIAIYVSRIDDYDGIADLMKRCIQYRPLRDNEILFYSVPDDANLRFSNIALIADGSMEIYNLIRSVLGKVEGLKLPSISLSTKTSNSNVENKANDLSLARAIKDFISDCPSYIQDISVYVTGDDQFARKGYLINELSLKAHLASINLKELP